jgi:hypothetical protein
MPTIISTSVAAMARYERSLPGVRKAYMDVDSVKGRMLRTVRASQYLIIIMCSTCAVPISPPCLTAPPLATRALCTPEGGPAPRGGDHGGERRTACPAWAPPPAALHRGPSMRGATRAQGGAYGARRLPPRRPARGGELDARVGGCRSLLYDVLQGSFALLYSTPDILV